MFDVELTDFVTIGLLIVLEGLLSADNALVLAILVLSLPRHQQRQALRYGILGAFVFRAAATGAAYYLIQLSFVKIVGAAYLFYLTYRHFFGHDGGSEGRRAPPQAKPWLGLTAFWATVVKVELTDLVFAIDSILVAVAMSPKFWVILTGGILGIVAMRLVIGQFLGLVRRYPALVDGAFVIIGCVAFKLAIEYLHEIGYVPFAIPKWLSLGLIVVIFAVAYLLARRQGPVADEATSEDDVSTLFP